MALHKSKSNCIRALTLSLLIILTVTSRTWASSKDNGGTEVNILVDNDPLQIRSAKLWMRDSVNEERCSASIVAKNVLLTAAHCVIDWKLENIQVRLSSKAIEKWDEGFLMEVQEVIFPPEADLNQIRRLKWQAPASVFDLSDYALVVLKEKVPAPFTPTNLSQTKNPLTASNLILTGFGISTNPVRIGHFHKFTAKALIPEGLGTEVFLRTVMCSGDSGGGVFEIATSDDIVLAAVNSRGYFCGPGQATWLPAKAASWIQSILETI